MGIVSVCKVAEYRPDLLDQAIEQHFSRIHAEEIIKPGMKVLLKPNLVRGCRPDTAVTTRAELLTAICRKLKTMGVSEIVVADSPGGLYTPAALNSIYSVSGLKVLSEYAELNQNVGWKQVFCPEGFKTRTFNIIEPILSADVVINVAKLKTHGMTMLSAGVKNMFGSIPGLQKPEMHYRHPELEAFSNMLCELAKFTNPAITIIDAIDCMEGNGPTGGTVRYMGLTMAARNVFEQDAYASSLIGLAPENVAMLRIAKQRGWYDPSGLQVVGDSVEPANPPFKLPDSAGPDFAGRLPGFMRGPASKFLKRIFHTVPKVNKSKCVGCGKCAESCPPQIIRIENGKAVFTSKGCISCFCCQEMCPARAIDVRRMRRL